MRSRVLLVWAVFASCRLSAIGPDAEPDAQSAGDANAVDASSSIDETVPPFPVSEGGECTITPTSIRQGPSTSRLVAIDDAERIFVAAVCAGEVSVAVSETGGRSLSEFVGVGIAADGYVPIVIASVSATELLLVTIVSDAMLATVSGDGGRTWAPSSVIAQALAEPFGLSLVVLDDVAVVAGQLTEEAPRRLRVARGTKRGTGAWQHVAVESEAVYGDLFADRDTVYLISDEPALMLQQSTDRGATFGSEVAVAGMLRFSDWGLVNGAFVGVGSEGTAVSVAIEAPHTVTDLALGLGPSVDLGRTLSVFENNTLLVGTGRPEGGTIITRVAEATREERTLDELGGPPSIETFGDRAGVVLYERGGALFLSVQVF